MSYVIHPLILGSALRPRDPRPGVHPELIEGPVISYLVIGDGHNTLVDTGGHAPDNVRRIPYFRKPEQEFVHQLSLFGLKPNDIDTIIITHLHWDHSGNNALFKNARVIVQRREYDAFIADMDNSCYDKETALPTKYELVDDDVELYPGIELLLMPGHSPGFQSVVIDTDRKKHVILSDTAVRYEHWEEPRLIQDPGYDSERLMRCIKLIDSMDAVILPGHDMDVFHHDTYPV